MADDQNLAQQTFKTPDWQVVEVDYRAGIKSLRQIASEHGVTFQTIANMAKRMAWERDLSHRIASKARSMESRKIAVAAKKSRRSKTRGKEGGKALNRRETGAPARGAKTRVDRVTEQQVVDANAALQVEVLRQQKLAIRAGRALVERLMSELDACSTNIGELADLIRSVVPERKQQGVLMAVSLGARAVTLQKLAGALESVIKLERQAFGLDTRPVEEHPYEAILRRIREQGSQGEQHAPALPRTAPQDAAAPQEPQGLPPPPMH